MLIYIEKKKIEYIGELLAEFDKESNLKKSNIHIYKLQNANAQNVSEVLSKLSFTDDKGAKVQIPVTFDKSTNSVVITCSDEQFFQFKKIIDDFDKEKPQVLINVLIGEISLDALEKVGVEWMGGAGIQDRYTAIGVNNTNMLDLTKVTPSTGLDDVAKLLPGFSLGIINNTKMDIGMIINLFKQNSNFNILSAPKILTEDNEEAMINVGRKVPVITNARIPDSGSPTYSYQYQDVGIILKITPHVSNSQRITLDISQEVKNLLEQYIKEAPLFSTREIKTKITVDNKKVIVIGGLIESKKEKSEYATPFFSKIPLIGEFFKRKNDSETKTNMFVILSPEIITQENVDKIKVDDEKLKKLNERLENATENLK